MPLHPLIYTAVCRTGPAFIDLQDWLSPRLNIALLFTIFRVSYDVYVVRLMKSHLKNKETATGSMEGKHTFAGKVEMSGSTFLISHIDRRGNCLRPVG